MNRSRMLILFGVMALAAGPLIAEDDSECSVWSVKGMRIGMTLGELVSVVRSEHKRKPKHPARGIPTWVRQENNGREWYGWEKHGLNNYAFPDYDVPEGHIISVVAELPIDGTTLDDLTETLVTRWGAPVHRSLAMGPYRFEKEISSATRYLSQARIPDGGHIISWLDWTETLWTSESCGIVARLWDRTVFDAWRAEYLRVVDISLEQAE